MSSQVYGGTGGGACAGCGGFPPNCRCPEQAEALLGLQEQLHHIDVCSCCAEPTCVDDLPYCARRE